MLEQINASWLALLILVSTTLYYYVTRFKPYPDFPVISVPRSGWKALLPAKFSWILHGKEVIEKGLQETDGPFQILTSSGYKIILPNRFAHELRAHPNLSFNQAFAKDLFIDYPGFDGPRQGLRDETFIQEIVRVKLTQSLGLVTKDLVEEANDSFHDVLGERADWQTRLIKQDMLHVVARLSARVFLGKSLCRNEQWLQISKDYTADTFKASELLRLCPGILRPALFWCIPTCRRLTGEVAAARKLILDEVHKRVRRAEEALAAGEKVPKVADTIGWMVEMAKGRKVDYVAAQLALTTAAIHTTAETMSKCLIQLVKTPEIIPALREEMLAVLGPSGWSKQSFYKMSILDSFLKEVQRTNPMTTTTMNRFVKTPITLSNGARLPAGCRIMVSDDKVKDSTVYPNPAAFDLTRYQARRQQAGAENSNQFVTVTTENMAFGYGQHTCPGRFFASNELKIALAVLLLKYDIRAVPDQSIAEDLAFENVTMSSPQLQIQLRRRTEELNIESTSVEDQ